MKVTMILFDAHCSLMLLQPHLHPGAVDVLPIKRGNSSSSLLLCLHVDKAEAHVELA
jgi:hypothetical protein